jgi:azurin
MKTTVCFFACSAIIAVVGCGKSKPDESASQAPASPSAALTPQAVTSAVAPVAPSAPPPAPVPAPKIELAIGAVGKTMTFDKKTLTVPAGSEVHLVLTNAKPGLLAHNWVLVNPGTEAAVAAAGLAKGPAANYLAPGPDVIAYTPLTPPGKTSEVTFPAPAPGVYPYICSFPGHYMMMKGTLTVTP